MTNIRKFAVSAIIISSMVLPMQAAQAQTITSEYQTLLGMIMKLTSAVSQVAAAAASNGNGNQQTVVKAIVEYVATVNSILTDVVKNVGNGAAVKNDSNSTTHAEANQLYTIQLKNLIREIRSANPGDRDQAAKNVGAFARERHDFVIALMFTEPELVYQSVLSEDDYSTLPEDAKPFVPRHRKVTGQFEVTRPSMDTTLEEYYLVESGTGTRFRVHVTGKPAALTGNTVEVDAAVLNEHIATIVSEIHVTN